MKIHRHRLTYRLLLVASVALTTLAGCATTPTAAPAAVAPPSADAVFAALAQRYLDAFPPLSPVAATQLGDHRYDAKLDQVNAVAQDARARFSEAYLADLATIELRQLSRANQVDARLLKHSLEFDVWQIRQLEEWRWNPLIYTSTAGSAIYGLMARDFAPLPQRLGNVVARLQELPRFLAQVRESLQMQRVPKIHAETALQQNAGLTSLLDSLVLPQLGQLPESERAAARDAVAKAKTAIAQHQIWLEKRLLPEARGEFRIGAALYDEKLRRALNTSLSREDLRRRANEQLAVVRAEMYTIARQVLLGRRGAPATPEQPSRTQQQRAIAAALELAYAARPKRTELFAAAKSAYEQTVRFVRSKDFVTVYDDPLDIIPMPEFQRGVAVAYCDPPGPLDTGQKTFYAISPIPDSWTRAQADSFLREYNTRSLHNLTIHEAMPGHFLQLTHANRYRSPLRAVLASGTFIEGWAVYAERLMIEQGYMQGDSLMRLMQLKWYLRSIGNAILDQAVHVDGMTRSDAMRLLTQDTFQEEREAAGKWVRVQLTAAQLPTYFVGAEEHLMLRNEAQRRGGSSFSLKRYHDALLSYGSPPVRLVRALLFDLPIE